MSSDDKYQALKQDDAEMAVLGACFLDESCVTDASKQLKPDMFRVTAHQNVFAAILEIDEAGETVDLMTVGEQLQKRGVHEKIGGWTFLTKIADAVPSIAGLDSYIRMVRDAYERRTVLKVWRQCSAKLLDTRNDVTDVLSEADGILLGIQERKGSGMEHIKKIMDGRYEEYVKMHHGEMPLQGIATGFPEVDGNLGGFRGGQMTVLAARAKVGKSSFGVNVALSAARQGKNVVFFSLEMSKEVLADRFLALAAKLDLDGLSVGQIEDWDTATKAIAKLSNQPIWIDDDRGLTTLEMKAECRTLQRKVGVDLVIVDYLELVGDMPNQRKDIRLGEITKRLRNMLPHIGNCSLLLIHQLSRTHEHERRRPALRDLRWSGDIEQDADVICFLHPHRDQQAEQRPGKLIEFIIAGNRHGPTDILPMVYMGQHSKWGSASFDPNPHDEGS